MYSIYLGQATCHNLAMISKKAGYIFLTREISHKLEPLDLLKEIGAGKFGDSCFMFQNTTDGNLAAHTYLGFDPLEKMQVCQGTTFIEKGSDRFEIHGQPFNVIGERLQELKTKQDKSLPFFFQGGAMGYFGYDSVRYLEPILEKSAGAFEKLKTLPDFIDAEIVVFKKLIVFNHEKNKIFLISGGYSDLASHAHFTESQSVLEAGFDDLEAIVKSALGKKKLVVNKLKRDNGELDISSFKNSLGKEAYFKGVKKAKEHILAGDIFQAVLSDKFKISSHVSPMVIFETLVREKPSAYQFYFANGGKVVLGASPEMLLRVKGGEIETHPIAGTRPRGRNGVEDKKFKRQLRDSAKENAEHLMLVDLARNDIGRVSEPGSVQVPELKKIKKFPGVFHIVSRVTGRLKKGKTPLDALASCFPAGTLSGAPKVRAMQLISEIEKEPRGFYGGAVILASFTGDLDSCIAIRSLEIIKSTASMQAGAGIVADSMAEKEFEEILTKTRMLRQVLNMVSRGFNK